MMKRVVIILAGLTVLSAATMVFAAEGPSKLRLGVYGVVSSYWQMLELRYRFLEAGADRDALTEEYRKAVKVLGERVDAVAGEVIKSTTATEMTKLLELSGIYKEITREEYLRPALDMIAKPVIDYLVSLQLTGEGGHLLDRETLAAQYFPGYGYAEPGYIYRKGKEISRELLHTYWQTEEKTIETAVHVEATIDVKLAAELAKHVKNLKLSSEFPVDIGGHIVMCVKASFDTKTTLRTTARKKYAVNKVWFELYRAKSTYWITPTWELCGKTYEMHEEYAFEEVVTEISYGVKAI